MLSPTSPLVVNKKISEESMAAHGEAALNELEQDLSRLVQPQQTGRKRKRDTSGLQKKMNSVAALKESLSTLKAQHEKYKVEKLLPLLTDSAVGRIDPRVQARV